MNKLKFNKYKIKKIKKKYKIKLYKKFIKKIKNFITIKKNIKFLLKYFKNNINTKKTALINKSIYSNKLHNYLFRKISKNIIIYYPNIELVRIDFRKNKKFSMKYNYSIVQRFASNFIKNGKKLYTTYNTLLIFSTLLKIVETGNPNMFEIDDLSQYYLYIKNVDNHCNINNFLYWIIELYKPTFDLRCFNVSKKYKKLFNSKKTFKLLYIPTQDRARVSLKIITTYIETIDDAHFNDRVFNAIIDSFFNFNNSHLNLRKSYIYKKVFESI